MALDWKKIGVAVGILIALVLLIMLALWLRSGSSPSTTTGAPSFGTSGTLNSGALGSGNEPATNLPVFSSGSSSGSGPAIFEIAQGPVVAATLVDAGSSTTVARYLTGEDGHVLDQLLGSSGATAQVVSDTTIPGILRAIWTDSGNGVIVQYLDSGALKSASLGLPAATTTASSTQQAIAIHFLPDNIIDLAASPDGSQIVYLLATSGGSEGYIANADGSNTQKLFTLPLSQLTLSWPTKNDLLVVSNSASGVPGIAFGVNIKTGAISPLLYGEGLTATENSDGSLVLYRTDDGTGATMFTEALLSGAGASLSFTSPLQTPLPEQCVWSMASTTLAYCAAPTQTLPGNYLDLWHRGQASVADTLVSIDAAGASTTPLYTPGTQDEGEASDMINLSLSPDENYLSFIAKDDGTLWGIRLP